MHLCEILRVLRLIYAQPPIKFTSVGKIYKLKVNERINIKWKLEIKQFMTVNFAEIYQ